MVHRFTVHLFDKDGHHTDEYKGVARGLVCQLASGRPSLEEWLNSKDCCPGASFHCSDIPEAVIVVWASCE